MEKRSDFSRDGGNGVGNPELDEIKTKESKSDKTKTEKLTVSKEPERILVRNNYPALVKAVGESGEQYVFNGMGAEVKVRAEDAEQLLAKQRGGCCGAVPSFMFELVK